MHINKTAGLRSGDWPRHWKSSLVYWEILGFLLQWGHYQFALTNAFQPVLQHLAECEQSIVLYTSQLILLFLPSSSGSPTCQCTVSHLMDGVFWIMSRSFCSPYFSLPIILVQVSLGFICLKNLIQDRVDSFRCFCQSVFLPSSSWV